MNGYVCFFNGKRIEVAAATSFEAQTMAAKQLKVPDKRRYQISVMLAEKDDKPVVHTADF